MIIITAKTASLFSSRVIQLCLLWAVGSWLVMVFCWWRVMVGYQHLRTEHGANYVQYQQDLLLQQQLTIVKKGQPQQSILLINSISKLLQHFPSLRLIDLQLTDNVIRWTVEGNKHAKWLLWWEMVQDSELWCDEAITDMQQQTEWSMAIVMDWCWQEGG